MLRGFTVRVPRRGRRPDEATALQSLSACEKRTTAYYENVIRPQLERGRSVLVAAHNNVIRTLMHHWIGASARSIRDWSRSSALDIYATPLVYMLSRDGGRLALRR